MNPNVVFGSRLMVDFSLISADVVIRGNFNPYIISPEWLMEVEIWNEDAALRAFGAVRDGVDFRSQDGEVVWHVTSQMLRVESKDECGELSAKVMELLPHTPVIAIGINYSYLSPEFDASRFLPDVKFPDEWKPSITKWSGIFHDEKIRVEMNVTDGDQGVGITFNHHLSTTYPTQVAGFARQFENRKRKSESMIHEIIGAKIT